MTVVPVIVEEDDEAAELDRIAWNLPRRPLTEAPGSPATLPGRGLASGPSRIVPAPDPGRPDADSAALEGLDWQGFLSRFFPGRRRHDLEALVAYGAYRRAERLGASPAESAAVDTWADDGGATR